jgi:hypothetical protein
MGYSFAAGTTDGPGSFAFEQGTTTSNPLWNAVRNFLAAPTADDILCHGAKPILLATGQVSRSYLFLFSFSLGVRYEDTPSHYSYRWNGIIAIIRAISEISLLLVDRCQMLLIDTA